MPLRNQGLPWLKQPFARWFYFGQFRPKCFGPLPRPKFRSGLWFLLTSIQPPFLLHTWLLAMPRPNPVTIHLNAHTYVDLDECALNLDSIHFTKSTRIVRMCANQIKPHWMRIGVHRPKLCSRVFSLVPRPRPLLYKSGSGYFDWLSWHSMFT